MKDNKDYISFECTHMDRASQSDPDEHQALVYADIDGYPADENAEGTVICRVWLMREKDGIYPTYLVDWHHNRYRMNEEVKNLIAEAKKDLAKYKDDIVENVFVKAYEMYKVKCMLKDRLSLGRLLEMMQDIMDNGRAGNLYEALEVFENDTQFNGRYHEVWPIEDTFRSNEWEDSMCMSELLDKDDYVFWKYR